MITIRASEIGTYLYCQRAWWYQKSGHEPQNQTDLAAGIQVHEQHGRKVLEAGYLRKLAFFLLVIAGVLAVAGLILQASL